MVEQNLKNSPLGKSVEYVSSYDPSFLFPISREPKRQEIGISSPLPFDGVDIWNAYEISWLTPKGKPQVALGEFYIPCRSPNLIESKSLKLYLNSLNQSVFSSAEELQATLEKDLSWAADAEVKVKILLPEEFPSLEITTLKGESLDDLDIETNVYEIDPNFLRTGQEKAEENLYTNLFKSNCLVTGQPDWASVAIQYSGTKINREGLLKYLISFRNHNGFHEQCVERIFIDILNHCQPEKLSVYARYTRRGGLDINPFRSNFALFPENNRDYRQ